ncbi:MAG TPA: preprotein translocase YidC, partial [Pseudolysinimonas sp.]
LGATLFGAPLGRHLSDLAAGIAPSDIVFAVLIAALVVVAFLAQRASRRAAVLIPAPTGDAAGQAALVARIAGIAPFLTVVAALFVPLAAALYLAVSSSWSLGERALLRRYLTNIV